jgi:hypothetical protein
MVTGVKLKVIFATVLLFFLGAIMGASWGALVVTKKFSFAAVPSKAPPALIDRLQSRLDLSSDQTRAIQAILDQATLEFSKLHQTAKPQLEDIRLRMRTKILQMLNDKQKEEYLAMIHEREQREAAHAHQQH